MSVFSFKCQHCGGFRAVSGSGYMTDGPLKWRIGSNVPYRNNNGRSVVCAEDGSRPASSVSLHKFVRLAG
jgi:hypothetical protein